MLLLLAHLVSLYPIGADRIRSLLKSPDLKQEMRCLERTLYADQVALFACDRKNIAQNIAKIRKKSMDEEKADEPLTQAEQDQLVKDHEIMMSYVLKTPVFKSKDAQGKEQLLTVYQLDDEQCKALYSLLSAQLRDATVSAKKKHAYRLVLLALACVAHCRMTKKFPTIQQIACELHGLDDPGFIIQEIKTGGGKSIISELRAVMLCAEGWTVDIATENTSLADTALCNSNLFMSIWVFFSQRSDSLE